MLQLRKRFSKWKYVAFSLASFAACFIFYWYISQSVLENKQLAIFLPTYQKIFNGAYSIFIDNSERLMYDIFISVSRVAIGFIAAVIVSFSTCPLSQSPKDKVLVFWTFSLLPKTL